MWGYIVDGILVLILLVSVFIGIKKGFFDSVIGLVGTGLSLVLSVLLAKHVANFVNKIFNVEDFVLEQIDAHTSNGVISLFDGKVTLNNVEVAKFCVWICAVVILFLTILIVIHIIGKLFEAVVNNSITIGGLNKVLGLVFGLARGCVFGVVLLALCSVLAQVPVIGTPIYDSIQSSTITKPVFNYVDDFVEKNLTQEKIEDLIEKIVSENKAEDEDNKNEPQGEPQNPSESTGGNTVATTK